MMQEAVQTRGPVHPDAVVILRSSDRKWNGDRGVCFLQKNRGMRMGGRKDGVGDSSGGASEVLGQTGCTYSAK